MTPKRPHASEGHLRLPGSAAGMRPGAVRPDAGPDAGMARTVSVLGDELASFDIRAGDRVVLVRRARVEHGDIVARRSREGPLALWKAYPDRTGIRLKNGTGHRDVPADTPFEGVVVAVVRAFRS